LKTDFIELMPLVALENLRQFGGRMFQDISDITKMFEERAVETAEPFVKFCKL
jgi:hypothetical protein